jgi:hypothetical protein
MAGAATRDENRACPAKLGSRCGRARWYTGDFRFRMRSSMVNPGGCRRTSEGLASPAGAGCGVVVGTSLGHGAPDSGGHERIPAASTTLGLSWAKAQDQQGQRRLGYFHTAEAAGSKPATPTLVRALVVRDDWGSWTERAADGQQRAVFPHGGAPWPLHRYLDRPAYQRIAEVCGACAWFVSLW